MRIPFLLNFIVLSPESTAKQRIDVIIFFLENVVEL